MLADRVRQVQSRLEARGVRDIKFCWSPGAASALPSEVAADVCDALEQWLDGRVRRSPPMYDSPDHCGPPGQYWIGCACVGCRASRDDD